jgi:BirA family biotin operon repressor/biotin-[acetyl-CoA-carboxylase] ligase
MSETLYALIEMLANGRFHSGEALAKRLGIGRAAVWKSLQQVEALGLELHAVNGRGYRLASSIELLDELCIVEQLDGHSRNLLSTLRIFRSIDSTSKYLKQAAESGAPSGTVCLAEHQSAGRGRRGHRWHSPYGSNIYLSILWRFNDGMTHLGGLSLSVAVAMMRCLTDLGVSATGIKWPNDLVTDKGKLAGILLDVAGESSGPCYAVIGIGLNYEMSTTVGSAIDQDWAQLRDTGVSIGRNEVVARLLDNLFEVISLYQEQGFDPFRKEWLQWDILRDNEVTLTMANVAHHGIARGIDEFGMLLLEQQGKICHYAAGEVSLHKVSF